MKDDKNQNPNIKRRTDVDPDDQQRFKFDETETTGDKSKFKTEKSGGKSIKKVVETGDDRRKGVYVKEKDDQ